jgi:adenylyl- and sulfurtransferase ThiI
MSEPRVRNGSPSSEFLMALEDQIREYRQIAATRQNQRARAEAEVEAADRREAEAREALKDEHGVETPEDARRIKAELDEELAGLEEEIRVALRESGAEV